MIVLILQLAMVPVPEEVGKWSVGILDGQKVAFAGETGSQLTSSPPVTAEPEFAV